MSTPSNAFDSASIPSLSFKDMPIGTEFNGTATSSPEMAHSRDYETGDLAYWPPNPGQAVGNPKMAATYTLTVDELGGEERSVWAVKPSALYAAHATAQRTAGVNIAPGVRVKIKYTGDKPNEKNPRLNAAKQYTVTVTKPDAFAGPTAPARTAAPAANGLTPEEQAALAALRAGQQQAAPF